MEVLKSVVKLLLPKTILGMRLLLLQLLGSNLPYQFETNLLPQPTYDFIVVGSGAGGSVVASRLSETSAAVLLLEAGKSAPPDSAIPALNNVMHATEEYIWKLPTAPQRDMQQGYKNNRNRYFSQGKVVGGSTVLNSLIYTRGAPQDYDAWAKMGNTGWDFESVLPYFKKSEDFKGYETPLTDRYHGRGGPLTVEKKRYNPKVTRLLLEAAIEKGYAVVDSSLPDQIGMAPLMMTTKDGIRVSAAESFLRPAVNRSNLFIKPGAHVTKIIFNSKRRAVGVQYKLNGKIYKVHASKEVIVCGGTFNTPKLLMLSGVGPQGHLRDLGIPVVAAVEGVGQNLREHYGSPHIAHAVNDGVTRDRRATPIGIVKEFLANRTGFLSVPANLETIGFANLGGGNKDWADIFYGFGTGSVASDKGVYLRDFLGYRDEYYKALFEPLMKSRETVSFNVYLARPESSGWVKLASSDPETAPVIDFNFFERPNDMKLLLKGIRYMFELMDTRPMKVEAGARYLSKAVPGCRHHQHMSEQYWECFARALVSPGYHPVGTSKMAPASDPLGVVDDRLRVRGVEGLRVMDASIMPQVITGNLVATVYMIGEKGADLIKQDWGYSTQPT